MVPQRTEQRDRTEQQTRSLVEANEQFDNMKKLALWENDMPKIQGRNQMAKEQWLNYKEKQGNVENRRQRCVSISACLFVRSFVC